MASRKHLNILKKGVREWNLWKADFDFHNVDAQKSVLVDLSDINLSRKNLEGINFSNVFLSGVNFNDTNLEGADLSGAEMEESNFSYTNLKSANLSGASLFESNILNSELTGATFERTSFGNAKLEEVDFSGLNLKGANFQSATMKIVIFRNADLSNVVFVNAIFSGIDVMGANLEKAHFGDTKFFFPVNLDQAQNLNKSEYHGESHISHNVLKSNPELPLKFLRGCGLSDGEIEFYKLYSSNLTASQVNDICYKIIELYSVTGIQFYSCFISYSSRDEEFVRKLYKDLQDTGVRCWFAPEDLKIGDRFRYAIDGAIRFRDKLLVVLSENSIESNWVETEVETALEEERIRGKTVLFPIRMDNAVMETNKPWAGLLRRERHIGDFSYWKNKEDYRNAFDRLIRDLKANA